MQSSEKVLQGKRRQDFLHSGRALVQQSHLGVRSAMKQSEVEAPLLLEGKSLYIFHLHGLLSFLPLDTTRSALSPWRLYLQQKACSRHNSQMKEGTLELAKYQETGLAIRSEVAATQRTQPTGPPGLMGFGPQGQPLPCFPRSCGASPDAFSSVDADRCCASIFYTRASAWRGR